MKWDRKMVEEERNLDGSHSCPNAVIEKGQKRVKANSS
jgi:hypothetical protein